MPEGDAVHRATRRLQVLVGQEVEVETPHPRAAVKQLAPMLDGRRLESVEAAGKNLLLRFEGGVVLRSHLRMKGRWRVLARDAAVFGTPWLVLRGDEHVAVMSGGSVLEVDRGVTRRLGPDILAEPPDFAAMLQRLRAVEQSRAIGSALPGRRGAAYAVEACVVVRAPHLYSALRCFCLGAFRALLDELRDGADLPFAFEEHASLGRPALYEYRPLVRPFVETRAYKLA